MLFLADKDPKFGLDLANGVSESIWDPINPVPKTLLFRYLKRRAHHLSPDPNILKPKTQKLKFCHFQDSGQSPLTSPWGPMGPQGPHRAQNLDFPYVFWWLEPKTLIFLRFFKG